MNESKMEFLILIISVLIVAIPAKNKVSCINGCLCEDGVCYTCNKVGYIEKVRCKNCPSEHLPCQRQNATACTKCTKFQVLKNNRCLLCPVGCETTTFKDNRQICEKCMNGYIKVRGLCTRCTEKFPSQKFLSSYTYCRNVSFTCPQNCLSCTSAFGCKKCRPGYYGVSCEYTCSYGCVGKTCDRQHGYCRCQEGWYGRLCEKICPDICKSCSSNTDCYKCKQGHYGKNCKQQCSVQCLAGSCDMNTGECSNGTLETSNIRMRRTECPAGTFGEKCEESCPTNCLECYSITKCTNCKPTFYGTTCNKTCSSRCAGGICDTNTGRCFQCMANFVGYFCDGCVKGKYGDICSKDCPPTCRTNFCDQNSGYCLTGCISSMYGNKCENKCPENCERCKSNISCIACYNGYSGELCNIKCSETCRGKCYQDGFCTDCTDGYYGVNCNTSCPYNCLRGKCNRTGLCDDCLNGFFGDHCEHNCSSDCCNGACKRDGSCSICSTGKQWDPERIGLLTLVFSLVMTTCLIIVFTVVQRRKYEHQIRTYTKPKDDTEHQMATFSSCPEESVSSDQIMEREIYDAPKNGNSSLEQTSEDGNDDRNSHVYSGPYECPLQPSGQDGDAIEQDIFSAAATEQYPPVVASNSEDADKEVRKYEPLTSERRSGNYRNLMEN